jgi:putative colanic acid biosynthesis acetyltransferase WcaF
VTWRLDRFSGAGYDRGRSVVVQVLWLVAQDVLVRPWWVPVAVRRAVLRWFGADIGVGVLIRHRVRVHWPWKLSIGDHSWIGEGVWILNLEPVRIGAHTCVSQEVMLCTGSHDRRSASFEFDNAPIRIGDHSWIGARAMVLRGVTVGSQVVVGATALVVDDLADGLTVVAPVARTP